jgi:hypothetical protein
LQNGLKSRLRLDFLAQFPSGTDISYAVIPIVKTLPEPLQSQVKAAFAGSISNIWLWVVGLGGAGIIATLPMQQMALTSSLDDAWGLEYEKSFGSPEGHMEKGEAPVDGN